VTDAWRERDSIDGLCRRSISDGRGDISADADGEAERGVLLREVGCEATEPLDGDTSPASGPTYSD
jgi:hypothetical protein